MHHAAYPLHGASLVVVVLTRSVLRVGRAGLSRVVFLTLAGRIDGVVVVGTTTKRLLPTITHFVTSLL